MTINTNHHFSSKAGRIAPDNCIDPRQKKPGIRCYGKIWGSICKCFGYAEKIVDPNHTYYVNSKSLSNWKDREKKANNLAPGLDDLDQIISAIKKVPTQKTPLEANENKLREQFEETMLGNMGNHLSDPQKQMIMQLFDQAIQTDSPYITFEKLVNSKNGITWVPEKAIHIKNHLLPLFPKPISVNPQSQIDEINRIVSSQPMVCFYKTGDTKFLGNFAICPNGITIWGKRFECAEAAYQWRKYDLAGLKDPSMDDFFKATGERAFELRVTLDKHGKFPDPWLVGERDRVMWEVLNAKFEQNPSLKELLDLTKGAYLLEHNEAQRDLYWSNNSDGEGLNMLGHMLMAIRDEEIQPWIGDVKSPEAITAVKNYTDIANKGLDYEIFKEILTP